MTTTEIATQAAAWLETQHISGAVYVPLPDQFMPSEISGAYRIQQAYVQRLQMAGRPTFGWKIALTAETMQQMVGVDRPVGGVICAAKLHESGAQLPADGYGRIAFECEVALRLGRDLPAGDVPFDDATIRASVDAVAAAFEVADDRNADYKRLDAFSLIADNAWNAGMVLGAVHGPEALDGLAEATAVLAIDGEEVGRGVGADALGHPLNGLRVLANEMAEQGASMKAGDWILTGTVIRTQFPSAGSELVYTHSMLGEVRASVV